LAKKKNVVKTPREMTHRQLSHFRKAQRRQRFILFGGISVIVAVILIIMIGWVNGEYIPLHKTVLQVYDTKLNTAYFIDRLKIAARNQTTSSMSEIATNVINQIMQGELEKQGAAKLGIKVNDADVIYLLKNNDIIVNAASMDAGIAQLLPEKLKSDYFDALVPVSDNQVYMNAIMVEDDSVAYIIRGRIMNGDNITSLVDEYAQGYFSQEYKGDFGFHSAGAFRAMQIPAVPVDYALGPDATTGTLSPPLPDDTSYKQLGYWLLKVNDRPSGTSANVTALLLSNRAEAMVIREQLENGDNVTELADQYSHYTAAQDKHGELGVINASDNISGDFNGYVFDPSTKLGEWSSPIRDTTYWTQGGYWVVQVVDRQDNSKVSDDDRKKLINKAYSDWAYDLSLEATADIGNYLTDELQKWAIDRATKQLQTG